MFVKKPAIVSFLAIFILCGCAAHQKELKGKIIEAQYKPISGDVYSVQGIRITVDVPLRTRGKTDYFYAIKKGVNAFSSPNKYLIFDICINNTYNRYIRFPQERIQLVGETQEIYKPLDAIEPDNNRSRYLLRNITESNNARTIYGIVAFNPPPDWEKQIKLQFQIEIDDFVDNHYVIFKKEEPNPEIVNQIEIESNKKRKIDNYIKSHTSPDGYIKPDDLEVIKKMENQN